MRGAEELSDDKMSMHRSARPSQSPCAFCIRNTEITQSPSFTDFWHEQWTVNSHGDAMLDDPTPHDVSMLKTLHDIVQKELRNLLEVRA